MAEVCNASPEAVSAILSSIRDEIVELVFQRKANVTLNFSIGTLHLSRNGAVEFRSAANQPSAEEGGDKIIASNEFPLSGSAAKLNDQNLSALKKTDT